MIRRHLNYANVVATFALVFAMSGGALAASHYLITSTKQISPKVVKALKGANGKNGANGANGTNGTTGPAGPAGSTGPIGGTGPQGPEGKEGKAGESVTNKEIKAGEKACNDQGGAEFKVGSGKATTACNGQTGYTEYLPEGKSEHGVWTFSGKDLEINNLTLCGRILV
jgi:hypothetical protein